MITADLINTFNISLVVRGTVSETGRENDGDRYAVPKAQDMFRCLLLAACFRALPPRAGVNASLLSSQLGTGVSAETCDCTGSDVLSPLQR